jgi:hypothetical protein
METTWPIDDDRPEDVGNRAKMETIWPRDGERPENGGFTPPPLSAPDWINYFSLSAVKREKEKFILPLFSLDLHFFQLFLDCLSHALQKRNTGI